MKSLNSRCSFHHGLLVALWIAIGATHAAESSVALKDAFKEHFLIGTAVNRNMVTGGAGFRRSAEQSAKDIGAR